MSTESQNPPDPPISESERRRRSWWPTLVVEGGSDLFFLPDVKLVWRRFEFGCLTILILALALVTLVLCLVSTVLALPAAVVAFWPWLSGAMEYALVRAITVVGLTLFAAFLYVLRHVKRITYGYCEVAVGVVGLWAALSRLDADRMAVGLGIAASVYVIVRGMVNIEDGRKSAQEGDAEPRREVTPPAPPAPPAPAVPAPEERPPGDPGARPD